MTATQLLAQTALRAIVEQTLDAKVFYEDDFKRACRPTWDAAIPAIEQRLPDLVQAPGRGLAERSEEVRQLKEVLAARGRGAWALVRRPKPDGDGMWYLTLIHDGFGEVHTRSDGWNDEPTFAAVVDRMVGMEIYTFRHAVEADRARAAAVAAVASLQLAVGTRLRDVRVGSATYSSAVVQGINESSGAVTPHLTKRGSARRYEATVPASRLVNAPAVQRSGPLVVVNGVAQAAA